MANKTSTILRRLINRDKILVIPTGGIALHARMVEALGYDAVSISGAVAISHILGLPDVGLVTMTEMLENIHRVCNVVNIPVIADCDTGFGNAINTRRTVQEAIRAGAAGLHIEDQVSPKRCGFVKGKEILSEEEAVGKYRAAIDARNEMDKDFVIIARTDARTAVGGSLDEAIRRAKAYEKAGVDVVYIEAIQSREEIKKVRAEINCHLTCTTTAIKPRPTLQEYKELGLSLLLGYMFPSVGNVAMWDMLVEAKKSGYEIFEEWHQKHIDHPLVWPSFFDIVGLPQVWEMEKRYLSKKTMAKYDKSEGIYDPRKRRKL